MGLRKSIGDVMRQLRYHNHKTQEEVAKDFGISRAEYLKIENGDRMAATDTLLKIANGFELSLIDFLKMVDYKGINSYINPENIAEDMKVVVYSGLELYFCGDKSLLKHPQKVTIIGKKSPTGYGIQASEHITKWFVEHGYIIVSGLEKGVDTVVQKTCLKHGGKSITIVNSGLGNIYPKENSVLANEIIESGGLILSRFNKNSPSQREYLFECRQIQGNLGKGVIIVESQLNSNEMKIGLSVIKTKGNLACVRPPRQQKGKTQGNSLLIKEHQDRVFVLTADTTPMFEAMLTGLSPSKK
jgi:transcriptional regulator with XRE-family HTH domain